MAGEIWNDAEVVADYEHPFILKSEASIIERHPEFGGEVLDLGCGTGRVYEFIRNRCASYDGVDLSESMLQVFRKKYANNKKACVHHGSMVDEMRELADRGRIFDVVLFSYNSIDYLDARERLDALNIAYRILKDSGILIFSTHNPSGDALGWMWTRRPWVILRRLLYGIGKDSFLYDDDIHGKRVRTYYARPHVVENELRRAGFCLAERLGARTALRDRWAMWLDYWIYYVARKAQ